MNIAPRTHDIHQYLYVSQGFSRVKTRPGVGSESFQVLAGRVRPGQVVFETSRVSSRRVSSVLGYVHSARANWVSYVARPGTLLRPLRVLLARSLTLPPSTPALSQFVFVSIFLHSSRFPFSLAPFPSLVCGSDSSRACQPRHSLECSVPLFPSSVFRLWFCAQAFFLRLRSLAE